uniref:Uncharacterized protein n=1 Tax=Nelumbo nucifera TaxID=4432 RepID=A0A822ZDB9_NELNU|nr:TPA_asm: hypothetical protein HUJ06_000740 [Nelumbo nucifera]
MRTEAEASSPALTTICLLRLGTEAKIELVQQKLHHRLWHSFNLRQKCITLNVVVSIFVGTLLFLPWFQSSYDPLSLSLFSLCQVRGSNAFFSIYVKTLRQSRHLIVPSPIAYIPPTTNSKKICSTSSLPFLSPMALEMASSILVRR